MASSCRQKIVETLSRLGQTHMMDLVRKVSSTYAQVDRNLRILQQEGIVESRYCGRMRMIKLNQENPRTEALLKALRILRTQESIPRTSFSNTHKKRPYKKVDKHAKE